MQLISDFSYTYIPTEEWDKIPVPLAAKIRKRELAVGKDKKDKVLTSLYSKAKKYANFGIIPTSEIKAKKKDNYSDNSPQKETNFLIKSKKKVEHGGLTYNISQPTSSQRKNKKYQVTVERSDGKKKTVAFGQRGYQDYTEHQDPDRRRRYQARASAIKKKDGSLAKDDPFSSNFYSTRYTW